MATQAIGRITFTKVENGKNTYIKYSDDGGQTFTAADPKQLAKIEPVPTSLLSAREDFWEEGVYSEVDGSKVENAEFMRHKALVKVASGKQYIVQSWQSDINMYLCVYDAQQQFVRYAGEFSNRSVYSAEEGDEYVSVHANTTVDRFRLNFGRQFIPALFEPYAIDGRNLLKRSYVPATTSDYILKSYYFTSTPINGARLRCTLWGKFGESKTSFTLWNSGGALAFGSVTKPVQDDMYSIINVWQQQRNNTKVSNTYFRVYNHPPSVVAASTIERIKLEYITDDDNSLGTIYTPAPEDQLIGTTPGRWIGTCVSELPYPPMSVEDYTWSKVEGEQGDAGADAEFHKITPVTENAIVNKEGKLALSLAYNIHKVKGAVLTQVNATSSGYYLSYRSSRDASTVKKLFTTGAQPSATATITSNYPDYFIVSLWDNTKNAVIDTRVVQVTFDSTSWVSYLNNAISLISQQGTSIANLLVASDEITARVNSLKSGVRNLVFGDMGGYTFSEYGWNPYNTPIGEYYQGDIAATLERGKTYTITIKGSISQALKNENRTLTVFLYNADWSWQKRVDINTIEKSINSLTFIADGAGFPADGKVWIKGYPFPNKAGSTATVTIDWVVLTEGSAPASEYISNKSVSDVELMLKNGEITLTAAKTLVKGLLLAEYAKIGSAVFAGNYMYSQWGGSNGETDDQDINSFDTQNPEYWLPNLYINFMKGIFSAGHGNFYVDDKGNIRCKSGTFENIRITGNSIFSGIVKKEKTVINDSTIGNYLYHDRFDVFRLPSTRWHFEAPLSTNWVIRLEEAEYEAVGASGFTGKRGYCRSLVGNKVQIFNTTGHDVAFAKLNVGNIDYWQYRLQNNTFMEIECVLGTKNGYERIYWKANIVGSIFSSSANDSEDL